MKVIKTAIDGVLILEPKVFGDERGFFMESFNQKVFDEAVGEHLQFVQDNHSRSAKGVLRGMHAQSAPHAGQEATPRDVVPNGAGRVGGTRDAWIFPHGNA